MICKDDSLAYLNHLGYNVVKLPRENVKPLLVLAGSKNELEVLGNLSDFVTTSEPLPPVTFNEKTSEITGKKSSRLDIGVGMELMNRLLTAMGAASGQVNASFQKAANLQLVFKNVLSDSIFPATIANYLSKGKPVKNQMLRDWIKKEGRAFVISRTIKSNSFGIIAYDQSGFPIDVDIKGIQDIVGVSGKVNITKEGTNEINYQGDRFLVFGFQALSFSIKGVDDNAEFVLKLSDKDVTAMKGAGIALQKEHVLFAKEELLDINF